jgi:hypothetical protein
MVKEQLNSERNSSPEKPAEISSKRLRENFALQVGTK